MEYGIVTQSEAGVLQEAAKLGVDPNDCFVISSPADMRFAVQNTQDEELTVVFAYDWQGTGVKRQKLDEYLLDGSEHD
jgi:hypothetical protein